ncbi:hypothetical protein FC678_23760 [Peribacillus simplex]|uniref:Uncharacterized protein n=1 Tax=Peribacillus simplex TaxID=1478 RepID=A0A9X8ZCX1_9BACI|nr:hypothetical protein [Peribacillus simplex]TKH06090.1 hypothetical protein FC678_23760 [Peribacillus simplex]
MSLILDKASLTFSQEGVQELVDTYETMFRRTILRLLKDPTLPGCPYEHQTIEKMQKLPWGLELDLVTMESHMVE